MTAGAILLSSVWMLSSASSRSFFHETRIATTQSALRLAAAQLRRDAARAGFLGHPNTTNKNDCGQTIATTNLSAIALTEGDATADTNFARNDVLRLSGNFATNERYLAANSDLSLTTVRFDVTSDAFRRSFFDTSGTNFSQAAFQNVFRVGRQIRVESYTPTPRFFFRTIQSVNAGTTPPTIGLDQALPGMPCLDASNMTNTFISPVSTIEYEVVNPGAVAAFGALAGGNAASGSAMDGALVRREVDARDDSFLPGLSRVMLEYAVEFRMEALFCTTPNIRCAAVDLGVVQPGGIGITPEQVQGLRFHLAARLPEHDAQLVHRPRTALTQPLPTWDTDPSAPGAARVRTLTFDVALPNN